MKRILLSIVTCCLVTCATYAEGTEISSKIKDVTIYLRGARVERTASASLAPGNNEIVFEGLSNFIDENSIEVRGQGGATILSVNYRINYVKMQKETENAKRLKNSLDSARLKLEYINNEVSVLDQESQLMQANYKMGVNDKTQFADDVEEWAQRFHKKELEIKNAVTKLNIEEKELTALTQQLQNQMAEANASNKQPSGEIVVKVSSTAYGSADFDFAYYVANAGWTPLYSLRAQNTTDPLKLDYDALVSQQTGEIWKDIKMSLSTGNPLLGGNKPELSTWYLNVIDRELYAKGKAYSWGFGDKTMATGAEIENKDEEKMKADDMNVVSRSTLLQTIGSSAEYTVMRQSQLNVSFDINLRYTVAPDGTPQQVRIQQASLPAVFEYASAPKLDKDAFLLAKVTGWEDNNLLPGNANLYFEGAYIGKSFINPDVTNDTLNLSFGRDRKINIDRKLLRDFSKKAFLGKSKTQNFVYEITVKNTKNTAITLNLEDQIPVSQTREIEVSVKEISKADYDSKTGKLNWKLSMQPNETKKIKLEYSVRYPSNKVISGM